MEIPSPSTNETADWISGFRDFFNSLLVSKSRTLKVPSAGTRAVFTIPKSRNRKFPAMSTLVDSDTRVLIQGITGSFGARHAQLSLDYGTKVVAGVTPGKGGQTFDHGAHRVPIFDTV